MWSRQIVRLATVLGLAGALGMTAAPAVQAQGFDRGHHDGAVYAQRDDRGGPDRGRDQDGRGPDQGDRDDRRDRDDYRGDRDRDQPPVVVQPPPVYVAPEQPEYAPPVVVQPVPVPVTPDLNAIVLPPLETLFPTADFADYPPSLLPLGNNVFALSSPMLFWTPDQAAAAQAIAGQLAQMSPGWGATVLNGPQGYGAYLTYQAYF